MSGRVRLRAAFFCLEVPRQQEELFLAELIPFSTCSRLTSHNKTLDQPR